MAEQKTNMTDEQLAQELRKSKDGRLYIAVHSGHGFFDIGKGHENPTQLRQRFACERKWFTDMIDAFRDV